MLRHYPTKLISFSLWGDNPKYTIGAIKNAELAPEIYPGWLCRFYVGDDVPSKIVDKLQSFDHVELVHKETGSWDAMLWRFLPMSEEGIEVTISRDTDSRLNHREKAAVDTWLDSNLAFHIMRDHRLHNAPVLGGMNGCRGGKVKDIEHQIRCFIEGLPKSDYYLIDQQFLSRFIIPEMTRTNDVLVHDYTTNRLTFDRFKDYTHQWPIERVGDEYVGAPFNQNDELLARFEL